MKPHQDVLVLHGLWMHAPSMLWLAQQLHKEGFTPTTMGYFSMMASHERAIKNITSYLETHPKAAVVAHSLGGLLTLETLSRMQDAQKRRVVCIGSPLRGSSVAKQFSSKIPLGKRILGSHHDLLTAGSPDIASHLQVGVIAGSKSLGIGRFVAPVWGDNDGTVFVEETKVDNLAGHLVLQETHTGMLFSKEVARRTVSFLRHGSF